MDKQIFREVAEGKVTFVQLDEALGRTGRSFGDRRTGALALVRRLGGAAAVLFVAFAVAVTSFS